MRPQSADTTIAKGPFAHPAPAKLMELVRAANSSVGECHLRLEGDDGKSRIVAVVPTGSGKYDVNFITTRDNPPFASKDEFISLVENPRRVAIAVHGSLMNLPTNAFGPDSIDWTDEKTPVSRLSGHSSGYLDITPFKDPQKDLGLLAGQFVQVRYLDRYGDERFVVGLVRNTADGAAVVGKDGQPKLSPHDNVTIQEIHSLLPDREFGGKAHVINGKQSAVPQFRTAELFQEFFPPGSLISIPIEALTTWTKTPVSTTLMGHVKGYAHRDSATDSDSLVVLQVLIGNCIVQTVESVSALIDMSKMSNNPIRTEPYNEATARATTPLATQPSQTSVKATFGVSDFSAADFKVGRLLYSA
jgi:hypothetical protein